MTFVKAITFVLHPLSKAYNWALLVGCTSEFICQDLQQEGKGGNMKGELEREIRELFKHYTKKCPLENPLLTVCRVTLGFSFQSSVCMGVCTGWFRFSFGDIQKCLGFSHMEIYQASSVAGTRGKHT